jgi:hypothetical protein
METGMTKEQRNDLTMLKMKIEYARRDAEAGLVCAKATLDYLRSFDGMIDRMLAIESKRP